MLCMDVYRQCQFKWSIYSTTALTNMHQRLSRSLESETKQLSVSLTPNVNIFTLWIAQWHVYSKSTILPLQNRAFHSLNKLIFYGYSMIKNHLMCQITNLVSHFLPFIATPLTLHYSITHLFLVLVSKMHSPIHSSLVKNKTLWKINRLVFRIVLNSDKW